MKEEIRPTSTVGFKPFLRPGPFKILRYVSILFGRQTNISRIDVSMKMLTNKIQKLILMGTNDGKAFFNVRTVSLYNVISVSLYPSCTNF
ncbi:unnamed protein product [Trichobilharzia regenti]|nr:unnamed protein product [Trichobilharzia regenti]